MDKVAGSGNDEFYTPQYEIEPLLKYIPAGKAIWFPFDTKDSNFVKMFYERNQCYFTHLENGEDFFTHKPLIKIDYIISNHPYSIKTEVLQKLFEMKIPFAMLVGVAGLFESQRRFGMFRDNKFEIMYLNKRVSYFKDYSEQKPSLNPPFSSVYVCRNILPEQIVFEEINKQALF